MEPDVVSSSTHYVRRSPSFPSPFRPSKVNGIDLRQATHDEAIAVLRLATQRVRLCVFRHQEAYREEDLWDVFSVELRSRPGEGLGFATIGKWYVEDVKVTLHI